MGKNKSTTVVSCRLPNGTDTALRLIAKKRGLTMNAMLAAMLTRRVAEIREKEGW